MTRYFALGLLVGCLSFAAARAEQPNIVVIMTDDQGWGDLGVTGNVNLQTPNIDSLARDGARLDRFYVCPVCSPTRAEFLTGRYHTRMGVRSTSAGGERFDLDESTVAQTLSAAGYATAAFGKWHNGMQYPYHPLGRGFDEYYGFCSGHWGDYFSPPLEHNGRLVQGEGYLTDALTDRAIEFIELQRENPFFVYLPYNTPHSPMQVPDRWWNRFEDRELEMRHREPEREDVSHTRAALAMVENIDWNVGRLLAYLQQSNRADKTIVIYFSDNGPNGYRWNGDMKGRKGSTDEGGVRSSCFVRWPGRIRAGKVVEQITAAIDLHPTLAQLAGAEVLGEKPLDGKSIMPLLVEDDPQWSDRLIFSSWNNKHSVRDQRFRLGSDDRLYEIAADPGQRIDVSHKYPAEAARLRAALQERQQEIEQKSRKDKRPFPIGHPDFPVYQLPARDGIATGSIERSNRFPNCSYFTKWTNPQDVIEWDVEVLEPGKYHVDVQYACRPEDVGARLQLSFQDAHVSQEITQAHDPPLRGMEHDRIERQESYVKDFAMLRMGTIELPAGRSTLRLGALEMPGEQVAEVRLLFFTRAVE